MVCKQLEHTNYQKNLQAYGADDDKRFNIPGEVSRLKRKTLNRFERSREVSEPCALDVLVFLWRIYVVLCQHDSLSVGTMAYQNTKMWVCKSCLFCGERGSFLCAVLANATKYLLYTNWLWLLDASIQHAAGVPIWWSKCCLRLWHISQFGGGGVSGRGSTPMKKRRGTKEGSFPMCKRFCFFFQFQVDLTHTDTAVIFGQGNVAIDVARMLLTPVDVLSVWFLFLLSATTCCSCHVIKKTEALCFVWCTVRLLALWFVPKHFVLSKKAKKIWRVCSRRKRTRQNMRWMYCQKVASKRCRLWEEEVHCKWLSLRQNYERWWNCHSAHLDCNDKNSSIFKTSSKVLLGQSQKFVCVQTLVRIPSYIRFVFWQASFSSRHNAF